MKVYIGPYKEWFGPYQLANLLQYVGFSENTCDIIGEKLSETWVNSFLEWIDSWRKRKVKIKIHNYDIWNLDRTLGLIILPALLKLKEDKSGVPNVSNEDVPDYLKTNEEDYDFYAKKWNYVLDEIIFAFQSQNENWISKYTNGNIEDDTFQVDVEEKRKYQERISNGFRLFGKYYESLWT